MEPAGIRETSEGWCSILGLAAVGSFVIPLTYLRQQSRTGTGTQNSSWERAVWQESLGSSVGGHTSLQETHREGAQKTHICLLSDLPPKPLIGWIQLEPEGEEAKWDSPCRSDSPRHRAGWRRVERGPEMESSQHRKLGHSWLRIQSLLVYSFPTKPVSGAGCSGSTSFPRIHAAWLFFRSTLLSWTLCLLPLKHTQILFEIF